MIIFLMSQSDLLIIRGVLSKGGTPALCLYPPLTQTKNYKIMVKFKDLFRSHGHMMRDLQEQAYINAENEKQSVLSARHGEVPDDLKGTIYEDQWKNNPYRDLYYQPELWDYLNLSNKAKDANFNAEQKYNEYVAALYDQKRQDEYNSESAKADRMRQAGQNPDLLGLAGASTTDEMNPNHTPSDPALNGQSPAISGFQMMTSVLSTATAMYKQIQEVKAISIANDSSEFNLFSQMLPLAKDSITSELAAAFAGHKENGEFNLSDWSDVENVDAKRFRNKRQEKAYRSAFNHVLSSSWYKVQEDAYKSLDAHDRAMRHFMDGFINMELDALSSKYKSEKSEFDLGKAIADDRRRMFNTLYQDYKAGNVFAGTLLLAQAQQLARIEGKGPDLAHEFISKFPTLKFGKSKK